MTTEDANVFGGSPEQDAITLMTIVDIGSAPMSADAALASFARGLGDDFIFSGQLREVANPNGLRGLSDTGTYADAERTGKATLHALTGGSGVYCFVVVVVKDGSVEQLQQTAEMILGSVSGA